MTLQFASHPDRREAASSSSPAGILASGQGGVLRRAVPPILLIWLLGTALLLLKLARGYLRLSTLLRSAQPATDAAIGEVLARAGRALRVRRLPELSLSDRVSGPMSAGLLRPRVILPERIVREITPGQLQDVLVHEIAHVLRRDPLIVLLQNLAGAIFWPHPLVKVLNRQLAQAREEVCDNYVLAVTDAPSYGRTLLKLAALAQPGRALAGTAALFNSRWKLERRVSGLLDERRSRRTRLTWRGGALLSSLVGTIAIMTAFGTVSPAVEQLDSQESGSAPGPANRPRVFAAADNPKEAEPWPARPDDGLLTLNLTLRMPDGTPAAGADVTSLTQWPGQVQSARTDAAGRVTIRAIFGGGARIHASSPDGSLQSVLYVTAPEARIILAKPVELTLVPSVDHLVKVTSDGKPVAGAQVVAQGHYFKVTGDTGQDGVVKLKLPADEPPNAVSAWHPNLGVGGEWRLGAKAPQSRKTALSLHRSAPVTIRLVDPDDEPVPELEVCVSSVVLKEPKSDGRDAILTEEFAAAHVRTDAQGESTVSWLPGDPLAFINVELPGTSWKIDEIDQMTPSRRVVTVHVRKMKPATGRLIMPEGISAQGLLITGFAFGPGSSGDVPQIRARRDGTFVLGAPSDHGYVLGLFDREWVCEPWTGTILKSDDDDPAQISLVVRPAAPLTVRVTRGPNREPLAGALVDLNQRKDFQWIGGKGKKHSGSAGIGGWLKADAKGIAYGGIGKGTLAVRVAAGEWDETKELQVMGDEPVEVEFHRAWQGDRKVIARMTRDGAAYQPSEELEVHAWTARPDGRGATVHRPIVRRDQTIEVNFDETSLSLLAIDREQELSGFAKLGAEGDAVELVMQPSATYGGTVIDANGKPLAGRTLQLQTDGSFVDVAAYKTDAAGKFRFTSLPVAVPLRMLIKDEEAQPEYFLFHKMLFEPGEVREGERLHAHRQDGGGAAPVRPLVEQLKNTCENVRAAGMHALVVLQGDDSGNVTRLTEQVLRETDDDDDADDDDDDSPVFNYLTITVAARQVQSEAAFLEQQNWPRPGPNEIVLIALDGRQKLLGIVTISADNLEPATGRANEFLARHKPEFEDAQTKLAKARGEAQRDGRRVWVIYSGPRCGPCFRLARWIDRHRELLEKDYVIVKVMGGLQPHTDEIWDEIAGANRGISIPWFAITEPDGRIIVTSEGPLGNMGMPGGVENLRHFRKMLERTSRKLSAEEIEKLIQSLSPQE